MNKMQSKERRIFFLSDCGFFSGVCFFLLLLVGYIHLITSGAAAAFIFMYSILILHFAFLFFFSKCLPQSLKRMQKYCINNDIKCMQKNKKKNNGNKKSHEKSISSIILYKNKTTIDVRSK